MDEELSNRKLRELKAQAQRLEPMLRLGKEGLTPQFLQAVNEMLTHRELVKVKFDYFKEKKKELAVELTQRASAKLIMAVGHVVVLFRPKPSPPE